MSSSRVPSDPNMTAEVRSFLDGLARTSNIFNGQNAAAATALLNVFTSALQGVVPASGGGTVHFLRADGTWATPPATPSPFSLVGSVAASSGATASVTSIPVCKMLMVAYHNISHNSGSNQTLQFALSVNNGGAYSAAQGMFSTAVAAAVSGSGILTLMRVDQSSNFVFQTSFAAQVLGGVETVTSGTVNAIQFSWSGGNFDDANGAFDVYALA